MTLNDISPDKEVRKRIHNLIREKLINIESNTLPEKNNKVKILLKYNRKLKKLSPGSRNKYIHFILYKSNIDTMSAIYKLSKLTGISQKLFSTAGLKDKRGVTTQQASVYNVNVEELCKFYSHAGKNKEIWIEGFK